VSEEQGLVDPHAQPSAVAQPAEITSPPRRPAVLAGIVVASDSNPVPNQTGLGWPQAILASVLALIGCTFALILVLLAGVPVPDTIAYALLLIGGIVLLIPSGRGIGVLRRMGQGLFGLINGLLNAGGPKR
jgi:hypothetical protein